jgi:endonuclease/exonuclease/phosphatase family metal-dependent hydrolase
LKLWGLSGVVRGRSFVQSFLFLFAFIVAVAQPVWAKVSCERFLVQRNPRDTPVELRSLKSIRSLRVATYNVAGLLFHTDRAQFVARFEREHAGRINDRHSKPLPVPPEKPHWQLPNLAKAINDLDFDIGVLQEAGDRESLTHFNSKFLDDKYRVIVLEGNDPQVKNIAFLVKRDLPFDFELHSYRREMWKDPRTPYDPPHRLFSRDVPVLLVRAAGQDMNTKPLFIVMGNHPKAKRRSTRLPPEIADRDPENKVERTEQINRAVEIANEYRAQYGEDLPIITAGDFNGDFGRESVYAALRAANFTDTMDLSYVPVPRNDRFSHIYFPPNDEPVQRLQLDGILVSDSLRDCADFSAVYRYRRADNGEQFPLPRTIAERSKQPSDHWPVWAEFDFQKILSKNATP